MNSDIIRTKSVKRIEKAILHIVSTRMLSSIGCIANSIAKTKYYAKAVEENNGNKKLVYDIIEYMIDSGVVKNRKYRQITLGETK